MACSTKVVLPGSEVWRSCIHPRVVLPHTLSGQVHMGMGPELLPQLIEVCPQLSDFVLQPLDPALKICPDGNRHGAGPEESRGGIYLPEESLVKVDYANPSRRVSERERAARAEAKDVSAQLKHDIVGLTGLNHSGEINGSVALLFFDSVRRAFSNHQCALHCGLRH